VSSSEAFPSSSSSIAKILNKAKKFWQKSNEWRQRTLAFFGVGRRAGDGRQIL
jgi:hypothetical protein